MNRTLLLYIGVKAVQSGLRSLGMQVSTNLLPMGNNDHVEFLRTMIANQGVIGIRLWSGREPSSQVMRQALEKALL